MLGMNARPVEANSKAQALKGGFLGWMWLMYGMTAILLLAFPADWASKGVFGSGWIQDYGKLLPALIAFFTSSVATLIVLFTKGAVRTFIGCSVIWYSICITAIFVSENWPQYWPK